MWGFLRFRTLNLSRHYFFRVGFLILDRLEPKLIPRTCACDWNVMSCVLLGNICFIVPSGKPFVLDLFSWRPEYIHVPCVFNVFLWMRYIIYIMFVFIDFKWMTTITNNMLVQLYIDSQWVNNVIHSMCVHGLLKDE